MVNKNLLAFSALAGACFGAFAQSESSVTLYGVADAGVSRVTGLKGGTNNQVVSGIMDGSRWGLRGNEEIGNGFRGIFTLESRIELNNGTQSSRPASGTQVPDRLNDATLLGLPTSLQGAVTGVAGALASQKFGVNLGNSFWHRQAFVGLVTPIGAVLVGRQYTPAYEVSALFDTTQTQSSLAAGQVAAFPPTIDIRTNNALSYRIQSGGFSGSLMYTVVTSSSTVETDAELQTLKGFSAVYKNAAFSAGLGYNTRKNELGQKSLTSAVLGVLVNIGPGALVGQYGSAKDDNPTGMSIIGALATPGIIAGLTPLIGAGPAASAGPGLGRQVQTQFTNALKQDARLSHIGYRMTLGANTVYVAYTLYNDRRPANADTASYGVAYSYGLSKRTDVNFVATHFNNKGLGQAAPGAAGYLGGVTSAAGVDSNSVALGLRHRF